MPWPGTVFPMLAKAGPLPASDEGWAYEIKWDGIRALAHVGRQRLTLVTRNGNQVTSRYPELAGLVAAVGVPAIVDGEIVAMDEKGKPSFELLQQRMGLTNDADVRQAARKIPVTYVAFDLIWLDDNWMKDLTYLERRRCLDELELSADRWQTPPYHRGDGRGFLKHSSALGLEGLVAKRVDSPYRPGVRSSEWLKVKNQARQELVVGGWTPGEGRRSDSFGALLVGHYEATTDGPRLRYAGKVGTGFTEKTIADLLKRMKPLRRATSPFADPAPKGSNWVEPRLVAEIEFTEWTRAGTLRHPSFKGLRDDKDPEDVVREVV